MVGQREALIGGASVAAYTIPTDFPESDGTLEWDRTTLVLVRLEAGGERALGYSYADLATAKLVEEKLLPIVRGKDPHSISRLWRAMVASIRNLGRPGIASMAIAAVDNALWDLKAKLLGLPLADLLGRSRDEVPAYGSGGFTSYPVERLQAQLGGWVQQGLRFVKMKVGRDPVADVARVEAAREAIGQAGLFVDANGAYTRKQALAFAQRFDEWGVAWFEEPVSSDDLAGLRLLRDRAPPGMAISAGEYGYQAVYFRRMLDAGAVDVLQADATRCGITGFMTAAALAEAAQVPLSSHCAPALHLPLVCAARSAIHMEWFHDHVRIERMLFDGFPEPRDGCLAPSTRPGLGLDLKDKDAERYRV